MARAAVPGRLNWTLGEVAELVDETPHVRSIVLNVPDWPDHRAGQHVDVRLTAEHGYRAQRSYSVASAPEDPSVSVTVELVPDGEASSCLVGELRPLISSSSVPRSAATSSGARMAGPLLLVAGGSGIVPLMSMLRHRQAAEPRLVPASSTRRGRGRTSSIEMNWSGFPPERTVCKCSTR